jgi:hypothetical protein
VINSRIFRKIIKTTIGEEMAGFYREFLQYKCVPDGTGGVEASKRDEGPDFSNHVSVSISQDGFIKYGVMRTFDRHGHLGDPHAEGSFLDTKENSSGFYSKSARAPLGKLVNWGALSSQIEETSSKKTLKRPASLREVRPSIDIGHHELNMDSARF